MTDAANAVAAAPRIWRRFSAAQRTARFAVYLIIVAAIVAALQTIEIIPEFLADAPEQIGDLLTRMWPIDWHAYPTEVHAALMETIHIASLGTLLALFLALPIGLLAAHNLVPFAPLNLFAKLILVSSRSVNSLVWALLFVGIFGPGAIAGTLAIAFRSIGFVGKLFGEALEESQPGPIVALVATGAPWRSVLSFGYWPQVKPAFWSIALFRFDINIRESAVLGLVGAGGIGQYLTELIRVLELKQVAFLVLMILVTVAAIDWVSTRLRRAIIGPAAR